MIKKFVGFSLIELLVGITIGGIILATVMTSYAAMVKTNNRLDTARQMQKEINFTMMRIADFVRNYEIDVVQSTETELKLKPDVIADEEIIFSKSVTEEETNLKMNNQPLFSDSFSIKNLEFSYPETDERMQPWVEINLEISSKKYPEITNWVKTTISSRLYK